jgi:hypothetical protein
MKRPTAVQTHVHTSTNGIAAVHSCKLRSPNLYEGLEIKLYEGLGISFGIRVLTLMLYPLDGNGPCRHEGYVGKCHDLSDAIANLVLDAAEEEKTPGLDQTWPSAGDHIFVCLPTVRECVVVVLQIMWKHQRLPDYTIHMVQIMIHKTRRTRNASPTVPVNNLMKLFDLAMYYKMGWETGTIREMTDGEATLRPYETRSSQIYQECRKGEPCTIHTSST